MVAKSGNRLLAEDAENGLREILLLLALVVTPNVPEASVLPGRPIEREDDMAAAARELYKPDPRYVLLKGGHMPGDAVDILFDGKQIYEFRARRIPTRHTHGTGCTYSAAITALLAQGLAAGEAVRQARACPRLSRRRHTCQSPVRSITSQRRLPEPCRTMRSPLS
ncbi:MAG: hypothetical protein KatS3mg057_0636 [Herpetosiphonaceae bacterium]|nr:MAG: hypothetical protein KatS3mg057_0636 [Herpetosiphonaceae bacterium]